jgi:hypothetical protein
MHEDSNYKYWHLGMVHSLDLFFAKSLNADYHLTMPDTVYSQSLFAGLLRAADQGHTAIVKSAYRTNMNGTIPEIEPYRVEGVLSVPAANLTAISVRNIHTESIPTLMTHNTILNELPNVHVLIWESKDALHVMSPHQTILYLDRAVLDRLPNRYFMTLDSELDKIIPADCPIYCAQARDEALIIELSNDYGIKPKPNSNDLKEFSRIFWANAESMAYWRFFEVSTVDPLNRSMLTERTYLSDGTLAAIQQRVREAVLAHYPVTTSDQIQIGLDVLEALMARAHDNAMMQLLREAAEQIKQTLQPPLAPKHSA